MTGSQSLNAASLRKDLFIRLLFAMKPGGRGSCERDDPRPRETKTCARAHKRLLLRVASPFSACRSLRYTARVRQWLNERENRFLALAAGATHRRCCRSGIETKEEKSGKPEKGRTNPLCAASFRAPSRAGYGTATHRQAPSRAERRNCQKVSVPLPVPSPPTSLHRRRAAQPRRSADPTG